MSANQAMKLLLYDGQGYWMCLKRLSQGRFSWWPQSADARVRLSARELMILTWNGDPDRARWERTGDEWPKAGRGLRHRPMVATPRVQKHLVTVILQCYQVLYRIHTGIEARGNQAGEYAGNVGAVLAFVKQRVVALRMNSFKTARPGCSRVAHLGSIKIASAFPSASAYSESLYLVHYWARRNGRRPAWRANG